MDDTRQGADQAFGTADRAAAGTADRAAAGTADPAAVRPAGRGDRRPRDMAFSLLILLLPIAILFALHRLLLGGDQPAVVDTTPAISQARVAGAFPVSEPSVGGAERWRPIQATFRRAGDSATLRIGYVSPGGDGVQLVQSSVPAEQLIPAELTGAARPEGTAGIGGREWRWYTARPGERALVLLEPDRAILIVGNASEDELSDLAAALP